MILLDTNALVWLHTAHPRSRPLTRAARRLYISPASLLEIQFLVESGRMRLRRGATARDFAGDGRWLLDDPPSTGWFGRALELGWTREPFDRLLVAHARLRGWRLATGDGVLVRHLEAAECLEL